MDFGSMCMHYFQKKESEARLFIDIASPSMRKIAIAIPDFKYIGKKMNTQT